MTAAIFAVVGGGRSIALGNRCVRLDTSKMKQWSKWGKGKLAYSRERERDKEGESANIISR